MGYFSRISLLTLPLLLTGLGAWAQLGIGTTAPSAKAALEIAASDKGLLIPRLTTSQRTGISAPPTGLLVYQTDGAQPGFWYYAAGGGWTFLSPNQADNLGNHTATQNLNLGTSQLVGNGGSNGVAVSNSGSVGIGTTTPAASAQLEVTSTTKGFLPPRLTRTERDAIGSPATGLVIFNTSSNTINYWNGTTWAEAIGATAPGVSAGPTTFTYTGAPQTYAVPAGVVTLQIDAVGAQGGGPGGDPPSGSSGRGGRVQATLSVTPGEVLHIYVGGQGGTHAGYGSTPGGWNGGGLGWNAAGGGGGATDIRRGGTALTNRILVAGGGGGQHYNDPYGNNAGGAGGGLVGANGSGAFSAGRGGTGGSQTSGGYINGAFGVGGDGNNPGGGFYGGAGGGGGYYGGGGGWDGGVGGGSTRGGAGGGGSSWTQPGAATGVTHTQGYGTGNGVLTITPAGPLAAPVINGSNITGISAANLAGPLPLGTLGFTPQAGGIVFTDAANLMQNNSQLFWNNSTARLGIGTTTPLSPLSISQVTSQNPTANQIIGELSFVGFNRPYASAAIQVQSPNWDDQGALLFKTSNSGAGAQERVRISTDGSVGIGLTDPQALLDVNGATRLRGLAGTGTRVVTTDASGNLSTVTTASLGDNLGNHTATQNFNLGTSLLVGNGGTTGLSITNAGNVGIGNTSTGQKLEVTGNVLINSNYDLFIRDTNHGLGYYGGSKLWNGVSIDGPALYGWSGGVLGTNQSGTRTAALYWNNNGNVGIGTTSPGQKLDVAGNVNIASNSAQQLTITSTAADPDGIITLTIPTTSVCNTCSDLVVFKKAGTIIGSIGSNLSGNAVTYNTSSDKRLKEHIRPTHYGLRDLLKIEVKDYNFVGQAAADRTTGFLAQDLFLIYPEAVKAGDDGATVTNQWAVDYGKLTPLLVQAIQDQQVIIEQLKAQLDQQANRAARAEAAQAADHADLQTLQQQMARLLGQAPADGEALK